MMKIVVPYMHPPRQRASTLEQARAIASTTPRNINPAEKGPTMKTQVVQTETAAEMGARIAAFVNPRGTATKRAGPAFDPATETEEQVGKRMAAMVNRGKRSGEHA